MNTTNPHDDARLRETRRDAEIAFGRSDQAARSPEDIENEIHHTRAQLDSTLSQLQRKLTGAPNEAIGEFTQNLTQAVVRNPVPTILLGTGLLWMMGSFLWRHRVPVAMVGSAVAWRKMYGPEQGQLYYRPDIAAVDHRHARSGGEMESGEEHESRMSHAANKASHTGRRVIGTIRGSASSGRERLSSTGQRLSEKSAQMRSQMADMAGSMRTQAAQLSESARDRAQRLGSRTRETAYDQPWMMAALGLAAGAAVGLLVPHTRREDELMGESRDRLFDRAREQVQEQMERGEEAVQAATAAAKEEVMRQDREPGSGTSGSDFQSGSGPGGGRGQPTPGL